MTFASIVLTLAAVLSVTPTPRTEPNYAWWHERLAEKSALVKAGGAPVVFLGDSITHFFERGVSNGRSGEALWKEVWSPPPYRALDLGFSGDRTEHLLWRITEGGELDGYEAKAIVLMIGTNNFGQRADEPPMDVIIGIKRILETIRAKQPKARTVLCAIFPRGADRSDPLRTKIDVVNREIAKFADGKSVIWCDFTDELLEPDGSLTRETMPDLLHPALKGYRAWTDAVRPIVDDILLGDGLPIGPRCSEKRLMAAPEKFSFHKK